MKKILLSLSLIAGLAVSVCAQQQDSKIKVSIGGEYLIATGTSAKDLGTAYGASIQGEYAILPKLNVTASAGYLSLSASKLYKEIYEPWYLEKIPNSVFYPVKVGLKYYFHKYFYAAGEAGASITNAENSVTSFAFAGGLGSTIPISRKSGIDVAVRYETWALSTSSTNTFLGFRAAYAFGF